MTDREPQAQECPPRFSLYGSWTRYSSWTARIVLLLEHFSIPYTATYINISRHPRPFPTPAGFVPALTDHSFDPPITIHDSLSICEYLAECFPSLPLWPRDVRKRAFARSVVAEFHSGFQALRETYPTNYCGRYRGKRITEEGRKDVRRVAEIWKLALEMRQSRDDKRTYLFGEFGIADAFFYPVLWRIRSYDLPIEEYASREVKEWIEIMWNDETIRKLDKDMFVQLGNPETNEREYEIEPLEGEPDAVLEEFVEGMWVYKAEEY